MRVLYVCHEPLPSPSTSTEQTVRAAAALCEHGLEVDLIFPAARDHLDGRRLHEAIARFYGVPRHVLGERLHTVVCRVPPWVRGNARRPWLDLRAARYARAHPYHVVYTRDPFPLVTTLVSGRKVVFETYRIDLNTKRRYALWRAFCYRRSNLLGVVTHSHISRDSFSKAGIGAERLLVAHNGYTPELMEPVRSRPEAREALDLPRQGRLVVYSGHVTRNKGLESLIPIARGLPDIRFVVLGHIEGSPESKWLSHLVASSRATNIHLVPRVPPARVGMYLFAADCLVIPPTAAPLRAHGRTVLPIKTFQYLAAGRPIVAPDLPDLREILVHDHNAMLVEPDRPEAAIDAICRVFADECLWERLAENALEDIRQYDWNTRARKVAEFLRRLVAQA